jgi:hypothetical protein
MLFTDEARPELFPPSSGTSSVVGPGAYDTASPPWAHETTHNVLQRIGRPVPRLVIEPRHGHRMYKGHVVAPDDAVSPGPGIHHDDALHPDVSAPWTALRRIGDCVAGVDGSRGAAGSRSPGGRSRSLSPGPSFPRSARPTNISAGLSVVEAD